ncbi:MAG: hypothetical protein PHR44_05660 [Candidatus Omnitrophica bacterium]|nr:hypothetical protein [Candidatus Omnitrophota bacterium]
MAVCFSLLTHAVLFLRLPKTMLPSRKALNEIEITYKILRAAPLKNTAQQQNKMKRELPKGRGLPPFIKNETPAIERSALKVNKPLPTQSAQATFKKKITVPVLGADKIKSPAYMSYYEIIREKIRRSAYKHYFRSETGEVNIAFTVSSSGAVINSGIAQGRTFAGPYLKEIALKSIYDASPFPPFPKDLDYPELPFTVAISFEVE